MAIDLTGGMDVEREYLFPQCPATDGMRDAVNMWVSDDRGEFGLPRFAVEAAAPEWDRHLLSVNIGWPDGRVLILRDTAAAHSPLGADGKPTILGAGPLQFECVEPFRRWDVRFSGEAEAMTTVDQMNGALPGDGPMVPVEFSIETTMAVPPWIQGTMSKEAAEVLSGGTEAAVMGGERYEQLFRARGSLTVDGKTRSFSGSGLRIRRQGIRNIEEFWGHCWQSALFPSGRAFGYNAYPPRDDGKPTYNEGYIFDGDGELLPARVKHAPWLSKLVPAGDDVSCVLQTPRGDVVIEGETFVSTFAMGRPNMPPNFPVLQQTGVRYRWDGEETWGMMERSSRKDKIRA